MNFVSGAIGVSIMLLFAAGEIYWFVLAWQLSSFWMFLLGIVPPFMAFTGLIGAYSLIFDTPSWIYSWFS